MTPIFVPFTYIHPPTWEALVGRAVTPWRVDDANGYLLYFRRRWEVGEDFVNIEHDVVVQGAGPGYQSQLDQLEECPNDWCVFPEFGGAPSMSLVRYRASFIEDNKDMWATQWVLPAGQGKPWTWLDSHLQGHASHPPCEHLKPPAVNTRPYGPAH